MADQVAAATKGLADGEVAAYHKVLSSALFRNSA
jgi:hypothetical protein